MPTPKESELRRLRNLAFLLDNAFEIPGINYRIGIEPILGLVPVVGDAIGYAFAAYLIWQARRFEAPPEMITRMFLYATLDFVVGSIPVVGDIFDFLFKPNARNVRMLDQWLSES
jgi:hypothetical protein